MKKSIWQSFMILPLLSLSCATKPPDTLVCVELSMTRGECIRVMSGEKVSINEENKFNGKTWWEMRPTNIIMPLESYAEQKAFFIKTCKKNQNMCEKAVSTWKRSFEHIDKQLEKK